MIRRGRLPRRSKGSLDFSFFDQLVLCDRRVWHDRSFAGPVQKQEERGDGSVPADGLERPGAAVPW